MVSPAPSGPASGPTLPGCLVSIKRHGVIGTNSEPASLDAADVVSTPPAPTVTATAAPIAAQRERQIDWARNGRVIAPTVRADVVLTGRACALRSGNVRPCRARGGGRHRHDRTDRCRPTRQPAESASRAGPAAEPLPGRAARTVWHDREAARPARSKRCHHHHRLRAPPRHQPQQAVARHHRRRRGRARLRVDRFAATTTSICSRHCSPVATCCSSMLAARARRRSSTLRARVVAGRLHRERPVVWRATRRRVRPLRHGVGRRRPRRRARRARGSTASTCTAIRTARSSGSRSQSVIPNGSARSRSMPPTRSRIRTRGIAT